METERADRHDEWLQREIKAPIKLGLEDPNETVRDFTRGICFEAGNIVLRRVP